MKLLNPKVTEIVEVEKLPVKVKVPANGGTWVF